MAGTKAVEKDGVVLNDLLQYVYYLLGRQDYTEKKLRQKLGERYPYQAEMHDDCIAKCMEYGYVDDARFAERFVKSLINQKLGPSSIRQKMYAKGFPGPIIDEVLPGLLDDEILLESARDWRKKWFGEGPINDIKEKQKAYAKLARKGFSSQIISKAINLTEDY